MPLTRHKHGNYPVTYIYGSGEVVVVGYSRLSKYIQYENTRNFHIQGCIVTPLYPSGVLQELQLLLEWPLGYFICGLGVGVLHLNKAVSDFNIGVDLILYTWSSPLHPPPQTSFQVMVSYYDHEVIVRTAFCVPLDIMCPCYQNELGELSKVTPEWLLGR